jgi:hypothetical protein
MTSIQGEFRRLKRSKTVQLLGFIRAPKAAQPPWAGNSKRGLMDKAPFHLGIFFARLKVVKLTNGFNWPRAVSVDMDTRRYA